MNVIISPNNIKKEKAFIDINGNIINKDTKQIIEENKPDYVPPEQPPVPAQIIPKQDGGKLNELIEKKIADKIDEIVNKKIDDILSKL